MKQKWVYITIVYISLLTLFSLTAGANPETGPATPVKDQLHNAAHVPAYALLTFFLSQLFYRSRHRYLISFLLAVGYGIVLELCQIMVPYRYPSVSDVLLNAFGAAVMLFCMEKNIGGIKNIQ